MNSLNSERYGEWLHILHTQGVSLLELIHCVNIETDSEQPLSKIVDPSPVYNGFILCPELSPVTPMDKVSFIVDPVYQPILKYANKKFPEIPDFTKVNGFQAFNQNSQQIYNDLYPFYNVFVQVVEFLESSLRILNESSNLIRMDVLLN